MTQDNKDALAGLRRDVEQARAASYRWGRGNYVAAYAVVVLSVFFSGAASVAASASNWRGIAAALALIPGLLAVAATQLKLQARSNWHYRKHSRLRSLLSRINYETPSNPSTEELVALANEYERIQAELDAQWEDFNFDMPRPDQRPLSSEQGPSPAPSRAGR
jgi:hypothetical protein